MNDGKQFELNVQQLLRKMGLEAEITGYSQDGGIDLIAINRTPINGGRYVVQCKDWETPVGEPAIRDLFGTVHSEGASKGILITTSSFTSAALRFAQGKPLELIDGAKYCSLCEQYGLSQSILSPPTAADDVFEPTATTVRLISLDCSDPKELGFKRHFLYSIGTLSIGSVLEYDSPGRGNFGFNYFRMQRVHSERSLTGRLELTFVDEFDDLAPVTYQIAFEGRNEIIHELHRAATAQINRRALADRPKSGCLVTLALIFGFAVLTRILWTAWIHSFRS